MTDQTITAIGSFGASASGSSVSALLRIEIDAEMHTDADGNEIRTFLPGDEVYLLVHHDSRARIINLRDTAGGDLQRIGQVSRGKNEQITFQHPAHENELQYQPAGTPSADWYGRSSGLRLNGRTLTAANAPCLGDISYAISAVQYLYRPSSLVTCGIGEEFPVDVIVEWREVD